MGHGKAEYWQEFNKKMGNKFGDIYEEPISINNAYFKNDEYVIKSGSITLMNSCIVFFFK